MDKAAYLHKENTYSPARIDAHVENATEFTSRASADTKKALEYQQKARRSARPLSSGSLSLSVQEEDHDAPLRPDLCPPGHLHRAQVPRPRVVRAPTTHIHMCIR